MDIVDEAQRVEAMHITDAIRRAKGAVSTGISEETCRNCGETIPEARRMAVTGCLLCIDCQMEVEDESA